MGREGIDGVDGVHCIVLDFHLVIGWVLVDYYHGRLCFSYGPTRKGGTIHTRRGRGRKSFQAASTLCLIHLIVIISSSLLSPLSPSALPTCRSTTGSNSLIPTFPTLSPLLSFPPSSDNDSVMLDWIQKKGNRTSTTRRFSSVAKQTKETTFWIPLSIPLPPPAPSFLARKSSD